jgi:hypothetical protein
MSGHRGGTRLRRVGIYAILSVAVAAAAVTGIGYLLPQGHVATRDALLDARAADIFAAIADPARYPEWRSDISRVEVLQAAPLRWREQAGGDWVTYEVTAVRPPAHMVVRIADPDLPFGGTWTYELKQEESGTRVTITERGEVYNPIFRFMSRFVFSHTATLERYLAALRARAAQQPRP